MRHRVGVHKISGRRGSVVPIFRDWEPGTEEVKRFTFFEVNLTPKQKEDLMHERIRLDPVNGDILAVPEVDWPERKAEFKATVDLYQELVAKYGEEGARQKVQEMDALGRPGGVE